MATPGNGIIGIGYQGLTLDVLAEQLKGWGVETLVDVRLNAISRKPGFSKRALEAHLLSKGIQYVHMPELGNARDNRAGFSEPGTEVGDRARTRFRNSLSTPEASAKLDELAALADSSWIAVFCFEARETECHRHEVIRAVRDRLDALVH